jgi:hypothetical protein
MSFSPATAAMYSVYIPTIHINYTEDAIRKQFCFNNVGNVARVDFAPLQNDIKKDFRQAFVHFTPLTKSDIIISEIETEGSYRFYPDRNRNSYWILCKNKAPVPETEQNIHQLSHNAKLMEERLEQMEQYTAQMEERMAKMEDKMSLIIKLNEKFASIVEVQSINIQTLSGITNVKEEPKDICAEFPLTREAIETEFYNIKTEGEEQYWRFHNKFTEELRQYSADTLHLFDSNKKEIGKVADKNGKNTEDIQYCIEKINYIMSNSKHVDDKNSRITEVIYYLLEQIAGKDAADVKMDYIRFNYIKKSSIVEELL